MNQNDLVMSDYDIFSTLDDDVLESSGSGDYGLHPPGTYVVKLVDAYSRSSKNTGNCWLKAEFQVLAEIPEKKDRTDKNLFIKPKGNKNVIDDFFLFSAIQKGNPDMGWKESEPGIRMYSVTYGALTGYTKKTDVQKVGNPEGLQKLSDPKTGAIFNIEDIVEGYASHLQRNNMGQSCKVGLDIKVDGEYKNNIVKWRRPLIQFETKALEFFLDGEPMPESNGEETFDTVDDSSIPF